MGNMTRLLLLLLWAGVTVSTAVDLQKRIIRGQPCGEKEREYHVRLHNQNDIFICGGSLIHEQWILTAAHCWTWGIKAVLGVHPGEHKATVQIFAPPVMYGDDKNRIHDVMLLQLPEPVDFPTVPLPDCGKKPKIGEEVQIAGFASPIRGPNNEKVPASALHLQCAKLKIVQCSVDAGYLWAYMHIFCAEAAGVDTCPGDSGGGYEFNKMIYGVHHGSGESACSIPVLFMDVCEYMKWIKQTTGTSLVDKLKNCLMCG